MLWVQKIFVIFHENIERGFLYGVVKGGFAEGRNGDVLVFYLDNILFFH